MQEKRGCILCTCQFFNGGRFVRQQCCHCGGHPRGTVRKINVNGGGGSCFPGSATIQVENGKSVKMSQLQVGDKVEAGNYLCPGFT